MNASHRNRLASLVCMLALIGCAGAPPSHVGSGVYQQRNLVSDTPAGGGEHIDPNLVNAWGLAFNQFGVAWVADNGTGVSTLYDGDGNPQPLVVTIPPTIAGETGDPTGIVFYGGPGFIVSKGKASGPSRFMFASEDGGIAGWAPNVDRTNAIRVVNNPDAIYKGLAISAGGRGPMLYATDFHNNRVDVFDGAFNPVTLPGKPFHDPHLPPGFAPFGIQAINGDLYVSYAKQDADRKDDVAGAGFGFVNVFAPDGTLVRRLISRGALNAPWGMALAPDSFGRFGSRLLVGNFGDGAINAYDLDSGRFVGSLKGVDRKPIRIDGLWAIMFGNGLSNQPIDTLFFTAGPDDEQHGLYGRLDVAPRGPHDTAAELEE
jgi:uncharacterized protein (TIGR03118 family)